MTKRDDCKRFEIIPHLGIIDNLTGELLLTIQDCCRVLNKTDERANEIVEKYDNLYYKLK
jgi:putative hemolysin